MSGNDPELSEERRREADRWRTIAAADMRVVRLCLEAREPMLGIAAYHCQQAAERSPPSGDQMLAAIQSLSRLFGSAPTWVAAGLPSLNRISVGMPRTA
jgi:hypothetical protein